MEENIGKFLLCVVVNLLLLVLNLFQLLLPVLIALPLSYIWCKICWIIRKYSMILVMFFPPIIFIINAAWLWSIGSCILFLYDFLIVPLPGFYEGFKNSIIEFIKGPWLY